LLAALGSSLSCPASSFDCYCGPPIVVVGDGRQPVPTAPTAHRCHPGGDGVALAAGAGLAPWLA
jgi:hypothetical protein